MMAQIKLTELIFSDDLTMLAEIEFRLQCNLNRINEKITIMNMKMNTDKIKSIIIAKNNTT